MRNLRVERCAIIWDCGRSKKRNGFFCTKILNCQGGKYCGLSSYSRATFGGNIDQKVDFGRFSKLIDRSVPLPTSSATEPEPERGEGGEVANFPKSPTMRCTTLSTPTLDSQIQPCRWLRRSRKDLLATLSWGFPIVPKRGVPTKLYQRVGWYKDDRVVVPATVHNTKQSNPKHIIAVVGHIEAKVKWFHHATFW
jgi:hypothetical protein